MGAWGERKIMYQFLGCKVSMASCTTYVERRGYGDIWKHHKATSISSREPTKTFPKANWAVAVL